jgi:protein-tyrosine phosphatase
MSLFLPGYIDLHNHILPGLDDGPRTMNESVLLAKAMFAAGYRSAVATTQTFEGRPAPTQITERLAELQEDLNRQAVSLTLLPGSEPHIVPPLLIILKKVRPDP